MIYRFGKTESDHKQWLALRQQYITATELASFVGLNPYESANSVLADKKKTPKKLENRFIRAGVIMEASVLKMLEYDLKWDVAYLDPTNTHQYVFTDDERGLSATPDAFRWDLPSIVECKTTGIENFEKYWRDGHATDWYISQVQVQLHCTNMKKAFLTCMVAMRDPIGSVVEVDYDPDYIALATKHRDEFVNGERKRVCSEAKLAALDMVTKSAKLYTVLEGAQGGEYGAV